MSALEALQDYASSSDEGNDDDLTVDPHYKADRQQGQDANGQILPSLPPEILGMFEEPAKTYQVAGGQQDPSMQHEGRVRSFEHVSGNWATYVYIPVDLSEQLQTIMEDLLAATPSAVDMKPVSDLHISISRTVPLQYQWIEPFIDSLHQHLASFSGFSYCFQDVEFYANDDKTRSFMGLKVGYGHQEMMKLIEIIDACLQEFSLPVYYENPSFHVSFGWCLGDYSQILDTSAVSIMQKKFEKLCEIGLLPVSVPEIWCKSGCKQFRIPLGR